MSRFSLSKVHFFDVDAQQRVCFTVFSPQEWSPEDIKDAVAQSLRDCSTSRIEASKSSACFFDMSSLFAQRMAEFGLDVHPAHEQSQDAFEPCMTLQ
jgi:hypothetical protein